MKYLKKALVWGLIGIPVGAFIGQIIDLIYAGIKGGIISATFNNMLLQLIICCVVGFTFSSVSVVFSIEKWSILKKSVIYFAVTLSVYLICAIIVGWIPANLWAIIGFVFIFTLVFALMWVGFYLYNKYKLKEINRAIQTKQH